MFFYSSIMFSFFSLTFVTVRTQDDDGELNPMHNFQADRYLVENKIQAEKVNIKLYYECLCPDCRNFNTMSLSPTVEKLASYLDVQLYPYGKAKTIDNGNSTYEFQCQHGPEECYGNKLHACAIEWMGNGKRLVLFNSCMMESSRTDRGSNDDAADECGKRMNLDPEWIKQCAKGDRGNQLLKYYGDESKKVGFKFVPYVMINGVEDENLDDFFEKVCAAFNTPPPECAHIV